MTALSSSSSPGSAERPQPERRSGAVAAVVELTDRRAGSVALTGGKAASLARAAASGLKVLPGVVLSTAFCADVDAGAPVVGHVAVADAFARAGGHRHPLVARSSSVVEDTATSSMAGQFDSVIGISGLAAFEEAVSKVLASRQRTSTMEHPIAVLVQPLLEPAYGGVLFGVDPVSGRSDHRVVSAVRGAPERLVSGEVVGSWYVLDDAGKVVFFERGDGPDLPRPALRRLAQLATDAAEVFGRPQDVEWGMAQDGDLWLLQSRPVTTEIRGVPQGPVYGPGPVAETFPEALTELEYDLWVPPLRDAVRESVLLAGTATPSVVDASEIVVCVDGHVAIDLRLAGELPAGRTSSNRLNLLAGARRLRNAWKLGRLRGALPRLAEHLLDRVDVDLEGVPALGDLTSRQLIALLHRSRVALRALHAHEILMGMLTETGRNRMTGASVALRILVEARQDGLTDEQILRRSPAVLALTAPRVSPGTTLPVDAAAVYISEDASGGNDNGILREALRLRVRWVQELSGRAAWELGVRLSSSGHLPEPELVRHMTLDHLEAVATKRAVLVPALVSMHRHYFGSPLPARFQLSDLGRPIRVQERRGLAGGTGAGGGIASGVVTSDAVNPPEGSILVTTTLTPGLAPVLGRLNGIVSDSGSVLSHLAILAREAGVATVVGFANATDELHDGLYVTVDGETGQVTVGSPT